MIDLSAFTHVGIRVTSRERAVAFYRKLGFELVFEGENGTVVVLKNGHGVEINLIVNATVNRDENILMDGAEKYPGYTHAAFRVGSLEETLAALQAAGIPISGGPVQLGRARTAVFIRDPDRNVIEFDYDKPESLESEGKAGL